MKNKLATIRDNTAQAKEYINSHLRLQSRLVIFLKL